MDDKFFLRVNQSLFFFSVSFRSKFFESELKFYINLFFSSKEEKNKNKNKNVFEQSGQREIERFDDL